MAKKPRTHAAQTVKSAARKRPAPPSAPTDLLHEALALTDDPLVKSETPLNDKQQKYLFDRCAGIVRRGELAYLAAGVALTVVHDKRLFELRGYKSFDLYVAGELGRSFGRGYQLIRAAEVVRNLYTCTRLSDLPQSEGHARHLAPLSAEDQIAVWQIVLTNAAKQPITTSAVLITVDEYLATKALKIKEEPNSPAVDEENRAGEEAATPAQAGRREEPRDERSSVGKDPKGGPIDDGLTEEDEFLDKLRCDESSAATGNPVALILKKMSDGYRHRAPTDWVIGTTEAAGCFVFAKLFRAQQESRLAEAKVTGITAAAAKGNEVIDLAFATLTRTGLIARRGVGVKATFELTAAGKAAAELQGERSPQARRDK